MPETHPNADALHEYIRGGLTAEEAEAVRAHVLRCPACEAALRAEARLLELVARADEAPPGRRRRPGPRVWVPAAALAALVAVAVFLPRGPADLPPYTVELSGGVQEARGGGEDHPPPRLPRFEEGSGIEIVLRPETAVEAEVEAWAFFAGVAEPLPLHQELDPATGAVRLRGRFGAELHPAPGEQRILLGVGPAGPAPTLEQVERALRGGEGGGLQAFSIAFEYGDEDGGTGLWFWGCDQVWRGPICGLGAERTEPARIGLWLDGLETTGATVRLGEGPPVPFVEVPEGGGLRAFVDLSGEEEPTVSGTLRGNPFTWRLPVRRDPPGATADADRLFKEAFLRADPTARRTGLREAERAYLRLGALKGAARVRLTEANLRASGAIPREEGDGEEFFAVERGPAPADLLLEHYLASNRGLLQRRAGDLRGALRSLERARTLARRVDDPFLVSITTLDLAETALRAGLPARARALLSDPEARTPPEAGPPLAKFWNNLGWLLHVVAAGGEEEGTDPLSAAEALRRAEAALGPDSADHDELAGVIPLNLASELLRRGSIREAREQLDRSRTARPTFESMENRWWRPTLSGRIFLAEGRGAEAAGEFAAAERIAAESGSVEFIHRSVLGRARAAALEGDAEEAIEHFARGRALMVDHAFQIPRHQGRAALLGETARAAREEVELLLEQGRTERAFAVARAWRASYLATERTPDRLAALPAADRARYRSLTRAFEQVRERDARGAAKAWTVPADEKDRARAERRRLADQAEELLDAALTAAEPERRPLRAPEPGELLLLYLDDGEAVIAFAADTAGVTAHRVDGFAPGARAEELSRALLEPFAASLDRAERVTILPSGRLRSLDLHALPLHAAPLVDALPVRYALDLPRRDAEPRPLRRALLVSDPTGDLAGARAEAVRVRAALEEDGITPGTLEGRAATREALREALGRADVLHVAAHADFDEASGRAGVRLADGQDLSLGDILVLERGPRRGVLSTCEGGRSGPAAVETLGLAHAFVLAGAEAFVASARPVDDALAARFSAELYEAGWPVADPEASFRRALVATAESAPEADWATFRLIVP